MFGYSITYILLSLPCAIPKVPVANGPIVREAATWSNAPTSTALTVWSLHNRVAQPVAAVEFRRDLSYGTLIFYCFHLNQTIDLSQPTFFRLVEAGNFELSSSPSQMTAGRYIGIGTSPKVSSPQRGQPLPCLRTRFPELRPRTSRLGKSALCSRTFC